MKGIPTQKSNNLATMIPLSDAAAIIKIGTKDNADEKDATVPASYALPPNYFDRNAKPIIVSRKAKDYSQSVNYKTKVYKWSNNVRLLCLQYLNLSITVVLKI